MDLTKKTVHYTQEGKTVFDRFYLDEDYNVPEQKEAVQRIVYSSAKLKTEDVRPVENYVKVTGKAYYKILYMTQGETTLSVLEGKIPFEEMIQELNKIMQGDSAESDSTAQKKEKNQKENQDNKQ